MAQVIKLKRSAVTGKTPQTSSLQLGELAVNTTDGKIYLHRSSSSDDSIQSVLTTDATITGSLKLSGSQHISGSVGVMDDITFIGDMSSSLTSTSSFSRLISVATASIGYLEVTGSNFAVFDAETGSFASSSDVQQILDESGSYLVDVDTGSLGKVTLISDITGSITSTGSFGKIFGDGSDLENVADPEAISGSYLGLLSGSHDLTLGLGASGSITSTASFGLFVGDGAGLTNVSTETGSFASGSDLHQILAESSSYVVESETGSFASGSDIQIIQAESASYVVSTNTGSFVVNSQTSSFASGSDLQIIQAESASYVVSTNTGSFLQNADTASLQTVGIHDTLFVSGNITTSGSVIAREFKTEFISSSIIYSSGSNQFGDTIDDTHIFTGSIQLTGSLTMDTGSITLTDGHITGSILSTGSFGKLFGDGGDLTNVADPDAISGSYLGLLSGSHDLTLGLGASGSLLSTASFGVFKGDGSQLSNVSTETGSFASGSDLHQILAESSSYVVESETGSFVVNSQTSSFASGSDVQTIEDTYASGSDVSQIQALTSSFLQNSDTASFQSTIITSSLEITGSITIDGDESVINLTTDGLRKFQIAKNTADDFKINRYDGAGSFVDQPITIASSSGITTIKDQLVRTGGVTFLQGAGSTTDGVGVYNDKKVGIGTGTTAIGDEKFLVAGDTGITGSLFVSSSITTPTTGSFGRVNFDGINGHTFLQEVTADSLEFQAGGVKLLEIISGSTHRVRIPDSVRLTLGTGNDFHIEHSGTDTFISKQTSGDLYIQNQEDDKDIIFRTDDGSGGLANYLQLDGSTSRVSIPSDSIKLTIGAGADIKAYHDGTNSYITNATGNLIFSQQADDENIDFKNDDGSGGVTTYIRLDGSKTKTTLLKDISGSLGTTGSFDRLEANTLNATISPFASGSDVSQIQAQTGSYASGSDLHQFLAESSSYVLEQETGSFASGSDLQIILAESASYLNNDTTSSFGAVSMNSTLFVQGNITTSGSVTAQEFHTEVVSSSVIFESGSTQFGDTLDDTHKITGSLGVTGSIAVGKPVASYNLDVNRSTAGVIAQFQFGDDTDGRIQIYADANAGSVGNDTGLAGETIYFQDDLGLRFIANSAERMRVTTGGVLAIGTTSFGTADNTKLLVAGDTGITGSLSVSSSIKSITGNYGGNISGSLTSTGSFGQLFLAGITGSSNSNALTIEHGRLVISSSIPEISFVDRDGTNISNGIQNYNGAMRLFTDTQAGHGGSNISFRIDGGGDSKEVARFINKGLVINVGSQGTTAMDENFLVNGDAGITGSLHTSGSITTQANISGSITSTGSFGRLNFDGTGGHTFIQETSNDVLKIIVGGEAKMEFDEGSENIFMQANNYNFRDASFNNSFKLEADNHLFSGSLTSTGSFGRVNVVEKVFVDGRLGIGTESPAREFNIVSSQQVTSEFTSTNALGNLIDLVHENSANGHNGFRFFDEGTQRMGLLHVQNGTRGYIHISNTYVSGSEIFAVDGDNRNVIIGNHASKDEKLYVGGDVGITGSLFVSSSITTPTTGSFGRVETTTAGIEIGSPGSDHNFPLQVEGHAYVKGPDGWNGNGDLAIVSLGSHAVNENFGVGYKYGTGMILSIYKSGGGGSFGSSTADAVTIADTTGNITLLAGADITGSIASTASFGKIEADQYSLATLTEVSGGLSSTGSFGRLEIVNDALIGKDSGGTNTLQIQGNYPRIFFTDADEDAYIANNANGLFIGKTNTPGGSNDLIKINLSTGDLSMFSGSFLPETDNLIDIGSSSKRFQDVFAVQTTVGAVFETGLRSKGIGKEETGTIVVWRNGGLVPCDKSEDTMVMGVTKKGKDEPIVMGAEPVLVTGDVKEGDFITTSTKLGHGKKLENGYLLKKEMFGKVIAQALENASGNSSLIKCMIRKM